MLNPLRPQRAAPRGRFELKETDSEIPHRQLVFRLRVGSGGCRGTKLDQMRRDKSLGASPD
jgi:hypothetical protein